METQRTTQQILHLKETKLPGMCNGLSWLHFSFKDLNFNVCCFSNVAKAFIICLT